MVSSENQMRVGVGNKLPALPRFPILSTSRPGIAHIPQFDGIVLACARHCSAVWRESYSNHPSGVAPECEYFSVLHSDQSDRIIRDRIGDPPAVWRKSHYCNLFF